MESEKKTVEAKCSDNIEREVFIMQCGEKKGKLEQRILELGNPISLFSETMVLNWGWLCPSGAFYKVS